MSVGVMKDSNLNLRDLHDSHTLEFLLLIDKAKDK